MRMKAYADRNASESKVEVGDAVVLKLENWCNPFTAKGSPVTSKIVWR